MADVHGGRQCVAYSREVVFGNVELEGWGHKSWVITVCLHIGEFTVCISNLFVNGLYVSRSCIN